MKFLANRKIFIKSFLPKPTRMLLFAAVMILLCGFVLLVAEAGFIYRKTELALEKERRSQSNKNAVSFSKVRLTPHLTQNIQLLQSTKNTRALAPFQNFLFAATGGGLLQLTETGELARHFSVLDGLPESDLTALAVFGSKLFIGTRSKGLVLFDGENFELLRLENHETKSITALFSDSQTLLIGTFSGGLLEFDGQRLFEIRPFDERIEHITLLRKDESQLIAGTFAGGLFIRRNQIWRHATSAAGLFSNRIVGAEIFDRDLFVATDLGVSQVPLAELSPESPTTFRQTVALPALSGLLVKNERLYLTKDDGEIFVYSLKRAASEAAGLKKIGWRRPAGLQSAGFYRTSADVWLLGSRGIWKNQNFSGDDLALVKFPKADRENEPTDNFVSALLADASENLWIGTFRAGIDVFSPAGKKLKHLESETIREINSFSQNAEKTGILAATSGGAISFGRNFSETFFVENAALPSRSIMQVAELGTAPNRLSAISTANGLVLAENGRRRVFSTVNGLPANSVFAALFTGKGLFVGTMSGLAQIENGRVARVFKTSNSELTNNWVSALCETGGRIFVGTYGGGVFELLPSGEMRGFESETGRIFVNPNALFSDGERLFAGTLEGVRQMDLTTGKWSQLKSVLPSETVLAIAADRENVYFGTTAGVARIRKNFWNEKQL